MMRALLHSGGLLLRPEGLREIADFLEGARRVALVTAASLRDEAAAFSRLKGFLSPPPPAGAGLDLLHLRWNDRPFDALAQAEALFMGGGNTYALLKRLRESGLLSVIRERVMAGMPYLGASAGSNVAGPTILTTNDWNVVGLDRFDALGLVSFNINPHYKETDPAMAPGSETRDERIAEYHVVNANPVVGLEEGALVRVDNGVVTARGTARIKIFRQGQVPTWHQPGERLDLKV
jgi:dipeptidase E